jgi:hypothetical protein
MNKFINNFLKSEKLMTEKMLKYVFWLALAAFTVQEFRWNGSLLIEYWNVFDFIWFILRLIVGLLFIRLGYNLVTAFFDIHKELVKKNKK